MEKKEKKEEKEELKEKEDEEKGVEGKWKRRSRGMERRAQGGGGENGRQSESLQMEQVGIEYLSQSFGVAS